MMKRFAIEWKRGNIAGRIEITNGTIHTGEVVRGDGEFDLKTLTFQGSGPFRLEISVNEESSTNGNKAVVTLYTTENSFSFFAGDINSLRPIFIPAYEVAVTGIDDTRTYLKIESSILAMGLSSKLQKFESEPEESYERASIHTRDLPGQTWLGLSRDMRIFEIGYRGIGGAERLWDWIQPRDHNEAVIPDGGVRPVRYRFLLGRGVGCVEGITRRLEEGVLPILHAKIEDEDIEYHATAFVSYESGPLNALTLRGTHYLIADGYGFGHMFTEEQKIEREELLAARSDFDEQTVLYFRAKAVNRAEVPRYAWFKNVVPYELALDKEKENEFDGKKGFVRLGQDQICSVSKLNGNPLADEETAVLLGPGETAVFEFYLPHRPISEIRATTLYEQDFSSRHEECREFWKRKLAAAAQIRLPEKRIEEMIQAGLLHLDLVSYGLEPEGTIVPTIGVYTAIGSESSPIIQFMDSMGREDIARRSLMFFLDKQHEDGFMQNYGGYMLETGAVLWCLGEHYRYSRDEAWIAQVKPKLVKAFRYLCAWRESNRKEELRGKGYGMLEGKTADPEDPFHSFMLNGYAYIGMSRLGEMLKASDPELAARIAEEAETFKQDIRNALLQTMAKSPVVPLGDGTWVPTAPPWVEYAGPLCLFAEGGKWLTHGSTVARDSLLGPLYLVFQEVFDAKEQAADFLLHYHAELMCTRNVALSQPYYSIHPWVHLKRGEVKPFLKSYYNGFSGLADRETYSFWEHYWHCSPHKTHEEGWFLMQTRWMLYMEEGNTLHLLPGIPRAWLEHGKQIELRNVASYFGVLSVSVESQLEQGRIVARIECNSTRKPGTVNIRLPHPSCSQPVSVSGGSYESAGEAVLVEGFTGSAEIVVCY